jgi:hypothetical protein
MAPVKLLAYHLYVRRISFYNNPTPYKNKKKQKEDTPSFPLYKTENEQIVLANRNQYLLYLQGPTNNSLFPCQARQATV